MFRISLLLLITLAFLMQYFLVAMIIALYYMFRYVGYELIVLAVLVDGYYGAFYSVPYLSIMSVLALLVANILKPYLLYTNTISN